MNNIPLSQPEIQLICLDMLRLVDKICKAENITYFLSGGTLLGAVRHKGFIPWDDDIDLMMPRPEYERFIQVAPKYMSARYTMAHPRVNPDYAMPWIRIWDNYTMLRPSKTQKLYTHTLFLDIFPIDGLPTNPKLSNLFFKKIRFHDILLKCSRRKALLPNERFKPLKRVMMAVFGLRSSNAFAKDLDRAAARHPIERAKYAGVVTITHYGSRERMPAEVFRGSVDVTFEGERFPAPIGWDTYLRGLYKDYMQLPPEEKRFSLHRIEAYLISEEERK